jgi:hypothetical protein
VGEARSLGWRAEVAPGLIAQAVTLWGVRDRGSNSQGYDVSTLRSTVWPRACSVGPGWHAVLVSLWVPSCGNGLDGLRDAACLGCLRCIGIAVARRAADKSAGCQLGALPRR